VLGVVLAALNSPPLAVALLFGEFALACRYVVVLVATAVLGALFYLWMPAGDGGWLDALLPGMSAQSTTGFTTLAVGELEDASKLAMIGAMLLMVTFMLMVFLSWLTIVAHGYPPLDVMFEMASATGTVGLSAGIARPDLEPVLKAILCFDMLAGRVEIFAMLVVRYPGTWFGKRSETL